MIYCLKIKASFFTKFKKKHRRVVLDKITTVKEMSLVFGFDLNDLLMILVDFFFGKEQQIDDFDDYLNDLKHTKKRDSDEEAQLTSDGTQKLV